MNKPIIRASIINKNWVISAAHCFQDTPCGRLTSLKVHFGVASASEILSGNAKHQSQISALIRPSDWNARTYQSDIVLLKLQSPIPEYTDFIQLHWSGWILFGSHKYNPIQAFANYKESMTTHRKVSLGLKKVQKF